MTLITSRALETLRKPQVQNLITITLVGGAVSSVAAAYLVAHLDPNVSARKEVRTALAFGLLSGVLSIGYKFWTAERTAGSAV
jgi:capsular polysaccharide biosynthesis protein